MIEVEGLTKRYGSILAVDHVSFTVRPGHVTGFLGPNGSGKSTTMRVILGLDLPTSGRVAVNGRSYRDLPAPLREVGSLLDARAVHPGRTAYNHLLALARSNRIPKGRIEEVLDIVGLGDVANRRAGTYSLGMAQRLGIAAALLGDPAVLLFDEPVNGLDTEGIRWIRDLMKALAAEGRAVFLSSHLLSEMEQTADRLVVIGRGRLIADTSVSEFMEAHATPVTVVRSPQALELKALLEAQGAKLHPEMHDGWRVFGSDPAAIGHLAMRHGIWLSELRPVRTSLEEAYVQLTRASVEYHARQHGAEALAHGLLEGTVGSE